MPARRRWRCARTRCRWRPQLMQEVVAIAHRHPPHGRGTVGMVQVFPNSRNVIPGQVKFSIDLRNVERRAARHDGRRDPRRCREARAARAACRSTIEQVSYYPAMPVPRRLRGRRARAPPSKLGYSHMDAVSGAGHDAVYMARARAGRHDLRPLQGRHQPQRDRGRASPSTSTAGCNVLLHAMLERAGAARWRVGGSPPAAAPFPMDDLLIRGAALVRRHWRRRRARPTSPSATAASTPSARRGPRRPNRSSTPTASR